MLRFVCVVLFCLSGAIPTYGNTTNDIINPDALRELAYTGQVDRVEAAFVEAQKAFENGEVTADDIRRLVITLTVSHPKMSELTDAWLRRYPNSPFAHVVQAWLFNDIAWNLRGPRVISESYPEAIHEFYAWHRKALEHATFAYEQSPRLIPASDAMIKFGNGSGDRSTSHQVLKKVMKTDPNMGTLTRALWLTSPVWGGSLQQAENMCATYAPGLKAKIDPLIFCRLEIWTNYYHRDLSRWAYSVVGTTHEPDLAHYRMFGIQHNLSWQRPEDVEFAFQYLNQDSVIWREVAESFDIHVSRDLGYPYIYEDHLRKFIPLKRAQIELDPYNPNLIDQLRAILTSDLYNEYTGPLKKDRTLLLTVEEEKELVRRQLISSPYEPLYWGAMFSILSIDAAPNELLNLEPYLINTMVYSNHGMWEVKNLLYSKLEQYDLVNDVASGTDDRAGNGITNDVDNDILCPLIRAQRLYVKVCHATKGDHSESCELSNFYQAKLKDIWADVEERKICVKERFSPSSFLYYSPIPMDFRESIKD